MVKLYFIQITFFVGFHKITKQLLIDEIEIIQILLLNWKISFVKIKMIL